MEQDTIKSPRVFGILSLSFGGLVLFFSLIGLAATACSASIMGGAGMLAKNSNPSAGGFFDSFSALYTIEYIKSIVFILFSASLLAVGIGQLKYKKWAAKISIIWSIAGILAIIGLSAYQLLVTIPLYEEMFNNPLFKNMPQSQMGGMTGMMGAMSGVISIVILILFYLPYPVLLLIFFSRKRVKEALTN